MCAFFAIGTAAQRSRKVQNIVVNLIVPSGIKKLDNRRSVRSARSPSAEQ